MDSNQITLETIVRRSDAVISSDLGGDIVMMDIEKGNYYGLENVAARIWALTEEPATVESLCNRLSGEYRVSTEQCREEVLAFLDELINKNIIQISAPVNP
jgi:hypothetical protein